MCLAQQVGGGGGGGGGGGLPPLPLPLATALGDSVLVEHNYSSVIYLSRNGFRTNRIGLSSIVFDFVRLVPR